MPDMNIVNGNPSSGTDLGALASSLNGKTMDNKTYQKGELKLLDESEKVRKEGNEIPLAKPPTITPAPDQKDYTTNPMQTFGSFAMVLATLGSAMTKHPLTNALNAGAAVMNAKNAGDAAAYKTAMDKWKIDADNSWKMADWEQKNFEDMRQRNKDNAEGLNRDAEIWAAMTKNPALDAAAKAGQVQDYFDNHQKALREGRKATDELNQQHDNLTDKQEAWLKDHPEAKTVPPAILHQFERETTAEQVQIGKGNSQSTAGLIDFSSLKPGDMVPGTGIPLSALDQKVNSIVDGASYPNVGVSMRSTKNPLKDAVDARLAELHPNFNYKTAQMEAGEKVKELAALAPRTVVAKNAVNEMDKLAEPMINAVKKLNPSDWPDWNSVKNAYERKTGNADIVKAYQAVQDYRIAFDQLLTRSGASTDSSRDASSKIADSNFSLDQIEGVRDQSKITGAAILNGLAETKEGIMGGKSGKEPAVGGDNRPSATDANGKKIYWNGAEWK